MASYLIFLNSYILVRFGFLTRFNNLQEVYLFKSCFSMLGVQVKLLCRHTDIIVGHSRLAPDSTHRIRCHLLFPIQKIISRSKSFPKQALSSGLWCDGYCQCPTRLAPPNPRGYSPFRPTHTHTHTPRGNCDNTIHRNSIPLIIFYTYTSPHQIYIFNSSLLSTLDINSAIKYSSSIHQATNINQP